MSKLFEQFKKETGDNWSYKNGWDFAPDEIITKNYIEWLEKKLTSDNSGYAVTPTASPKSCEGCRYSKSVPMEKDV